MNDVRTKIAAITVALGLGGLGGYAISSNKSSKEVAVAPAAEGTKVIRRTIHAKRHRTRAASHRQADRHATAGTALASEAVSTGSSGSGSAYSGSSGSPVRTGSSGSSQSGSSHSPVTTGSSGGAGGAGGGGGDDRGEVEHEGGD